ncbi:hypothetical protein OWR29_04165 [Actinoplanes sp. Pm04-4]|uniref:Uncharacterized protein n=1 Tax=Paractinoplanes pyxinae TaxID=2997416 RepID=A0ABT4ASF4_9ACTN|nr:hypothetical protein [Actinoplanes pyxinae]MCY1137182.1 hypothetical protein [Actinoplanes pyxinae]
MRFDGNELFGRGADDHGRRRCQGAWRNHKTRGFGANSPLGSVRVGGPAKARLTSSDSRVRIEPLGDEVQMITNADDVGLWSGKVTVTGEGTVTMQVAVTALQADGKAPLAPTKVLPIAIRANEPGRLSVSRRKLRERGEPAGEKAR